MVFNKYQVIKNAISYELANFIYNYFLLKRDAVKFMYDNNITYDTCLLYTSPSPRDRQKSRMPSSA